MDTTTHRYRDGRLGALAELASLVDARMEDDPAPDPAPSEQDGTEPDQDGEDPKGGESGQPDASTGVKTWDDFISALPGDQQTLVKAEIDRRDKETRKARNEAKNLRDRVNKAEPKAAQHDDAVEKQKSAEERSEELNQTLRTDNDGLRRRLVAQEIRVQAGAKGFASADDPVAFLDATTFLGTDLEPDVDAIGDALDELLVNKPHLAKAEPKPRPPAPAKGQGTSNNPAPTVDSQAAAARKAGDHTRAIELEMQKLHVPVIR